MPIASPHRPTGSALRRQYRPHRSRRVLLGAAFAVAALVGVSACGQSDAGDDIDDAADTGAEGAKPGLDQRDNFDERLFVATSADSRDIVEGSQIEITLGDGQINAYAGCNRIFGTYRLEGNTLIAGPLASTRMACEPELMDQDTWLIRLLESGPELTLDGDEMTLVGSDGTLVLSPDSTSSDSPADDDEPRGDDQTDPAD